MQQNNIIFLYVIFNSLERNSITFNNQREFKKKKKNNNNNNNNNLKNKKTKSQFKKQN